MQKKSSKNGYTSKRKLSFILIDEIWKEYKCKNQIKELDKSAFSKKKGDKVEN